MAVKLIALVLLAIQQAAQAHCPSYCNYGSGASSGGYNSQSSSIYSGRSLYGRQSSALNAVSGCGGCGASVSAHRPLQQGYSAPYTALGKQRQYDIRVEYQRPRPAKVIYKPIVVRQPYAVPVPHPVAHPVYVNKYVPVPVHQPARLVVADDSSYGRRVAGALVAPSRFGRLSTGYVGGHGGRHCRPPCHHGGGVATSSRLTQLGQQAQSIVYVGEHDD